MPRVPWKGMGVMPEIKITLEVICAKCGDSLDEQVDVDSSPRCPVIRIRPCQHCLDTSYDDGFEMAIDEGMV